MCGLANGLSPAIAVAPSAAPGANASPPDYTDRYNTKLTAEQEAAFQKWAQAQGRAGDTRDYDLRGAYLAGASEAANGHLPDTFKKPNHPTFSKESKYNGVDGNEGGEWVKSGDKWEFKASKTNVSMYGADNLRRYFGDVEPGNTLTLP